MRFAFCRNTPIRELAGRCLEEDDIFSSVFQITTPGAVLHSEEKSIPSRDPNIGPLNVLIITLLVQALGAAAVLAPAVIAPSIATALKIPVSSVGIFVSIVYLSGICAALYSGTLIARWGPIRASQIGLLLCAAGLACVATGVTGLGVVGAVLVGLGYGPITPSSSHILIRTTPAARLSTVFSIKQTGVPLGGAIAGLLVPPQEVAFGWTWAILSISAGCVVMLLLAQSLSAELDTDRSNHTQHSFAASIFNPVRLVVSDRALLNLAACSFVFSGVQLALSSYLSTYLNLDLGWTLLAAGVAVSVVQVAGMAGRIVWGIIADAGLGAHRTLTLLAVLMGAGCIATALFSNDSHRFWVFAVLIAFGASAVGWNGVFLAEVARLAPPGKAAQATGGTLAFTYLGVVFWLPVFGFIANAAGGHHISYLSLCVPLLLCLGFLLKEGRA
jgi:sugar phosphate permease